MAVGRGFGTIARTPAGTTPGGGGVTGANNGLDLDGANAVLGQDFGEAGDPAQLLSDREIPMAGFRLRCIDGLNTFLDLDPVGQTAVIGSSANNFIQLQSGINETLQYFQQAGFRAINCDLNAEAYSLGDIDGASGGINFAMDGSFRTYTMQSLAGGIALQFDQINGSYIIGDVSGIANTTLIELSDAAQTFAVSTGGASAQFLALDMAAGLFRIGDIDGTAQQTFLAIDDPTTSMVFSSGGNSGMDLNIAAGIFQIGDLSGVGNSSAFTITDSQERFVFGSNTNQYLILDGIGDTYAIGDINNVFNSGLLTLGGGLIIASLNANTLMNLNPSDMSIGDISVAANGGVLQVNDAANVINISNTANNIGLNINGVAGFNGTVANPVTITVDGGIVTNVA